MDRSVCPLVQEEVVLQVRTKKIRPRENKNPATRYTFSSPKRPRKGPVSCTKVDGKILIFLFCLHTDILFCPFGKIKLWRHFISLNFYRPFLSYAAEISASWQLYNEAAATPLNSQAQGCMCGQVYLQTDAALSLDI